MLTNYDTGARLEPYVWPGDTGRVDLDTDEGVTVITVYAESGSPGGAVHLHVERHADTAVQITVN